METYGVSFDGFQPSCGWPMCKHVEEELIPKAEFKYKTKICRELVKELGDYIGDCREQLGRFNDEESK